MSPRTPQFDKIEKARLARKRSARKRQYIPIQQFCEGNLRHFMTQLPPTVDLHDWTEACIHLDPGFVCRLVEERDFTRLADPREARCTLPELVLLCEWYLDDYLGPYFRSLYEPCRSRTDHKDLKAASRPERSSREYVENKDAFRSTVEETLEMHPDYQKILEDLRGSPDEWKWGNTPLSWFKHIEIQAHRSVRALVKAKIPCGSCNFYRHFDGHCLLKSVRRYQTGMGCSSYRPIVVDPGNLIGPTNPEILDKISRRINGSLARTVEEAMGSPRQIRRLERLHLTVLDWQSQGMMTSTTRIVLAQRFQVSPKTIDRDRQELVKLLNRFRETDSELRELFRQVEMHEEFSSQIPDDFNPI